MDVAALKAMISGDAKLTAAEKKDIIEGAFALGSHKTFTISLTLENRQYTERQGFDGAAGEVGSRATFAFADDHTLVLQEDCCGTTTFDVTQRPQGFALKTTKMGVPGGAAPGEADVVVSRILSSQVRSPWRTELRALRGLFAFMASAALLLEACQSTAPSPTPAAVATASPAAFRPSFAPVPCPDDVTADVVTPVSCGRLTVLEDRSRPSGRTIQIFVARFDPPGGTTTPDPVITLGHLASQDGYGGMAGGGQRTHRVLYLIDPRGIGHSTPALDCPEVATVGPDVAGLRLRDPARRTMLLAAVTACHDRLVAQGIDLAAYDLAANANDIEDLRLTLGIDTWNLNTNGDANRIAFEVARQFPRGVRSLIVDSPNLPEPDFVTIAPTALDLSISRLAAACAAQPACSREFIRISPR